MAQSPEAKAIIVASIISSLTAIIVAFVTSSINSERVVNEKVDEIARANLEERAANQVYTAERAGLVLVMVKAGNDTPDMRLASANGYLDGVRIATGAAQDATVPGVPSIGESSFVMPVPDKSEWEVRTTKEDQVIVRWFSPIPLVAE